MTRTVRLWRVVEFTHASLALTTLQKDFVVGSEVRPILGVSIYSRAEES